MTTQALSERNPRGFFNGEFFLGELRRSWPSCLLYFLAYFFGLTVPLLVELSSYRRSDFYHISNSGMHTMREFDYYVPWAFVALAMLCALWAGISACAYLQKRTSAYHFHSMPIRREGILAVKACVAVTDFVIALLPNLLISSGIVMLMRQAWWLIAPVGLYCLFAFVLALAFTLLCGTLCGTKSFHLIFTGITGFLGPIVLFALWLIADTTCHRLRVDYLLLDGNNGSMLAYSSPFAYLVWKLEDAGGIPLSGFLVLSAFTLLCFAGAMWLIRRRPTEAAESPMVFRPVGTALKYFVMTMAAIFLGFFFGEIFSDDVWTIFGMFCGALLSFMLMNVLIHRTARKMFSGLAGICVFAVLFTAGCFGLDGWFSYKDSHGYARAHVASVSVADNVHMLDTFTFADPEIVDAAVAFVDGYFTALSTDAHDGNPIGRLYPVAEKAEVEKLLLPDGSEEVVDAMYYSIDVTEPIYIRETTKWGTSRIWRLNLWLYHELDEITETLCRAIADGEEFREAYVSLLLSPENSHLVEAVYHDEIGDEFAEFDGDYADFVANSPTYAAIEAEARALVSYDLFQTRCINEIDVRTADHIWYSLPVYEWQTKLIEVLNDGMTPEAIIEETTSGFVGKKVDGEKGYILAIRTDPESGEVIRVVQLTDRALITYLCRESLNVGNQRGVHYFLTRVDHDYSIQDTYYGYHIQFAKGKVPAELIDLLK